MKQPLEFYGKSVLTNQNWEQILEQQQCPFLERRCIKQRKSNPNQSIGACIVRYQKAPLVICPHRFLEGQQIFLDAMSLMTVKKAQFFVVPEIAIPGGNVDYFLVAMRGDAVLDYLGLEIQGLDTTGSGGIWQAREDLRDGDLRTRYSYGINWKMSAKTVLIQLHHKTETFETLGRKLILVLQQQFFDYISREFQTAHLQVEQQANSAHFHIYDCVELNHRFRLRLTERKSTDMRGIEQMLKLGKKANISEQAIIQRIKAKLPDAIQLQV